MNPTGYAQVVDELQAGAVVREYTWGSQLISKLETRNSKQSFYGFDGHGSVRYLTDTTGAVTDTYDYDGFGNLLVSTGTTTNNYRFAGEQWDPNLGLYYNRARYLDVRSGRFWSMDQEEAVSIADPTSLHRYLYSEADPVDFADPTGLFTQADGYAVERAIRPQYTADHIGDLVNFGGWARIGRNIRLRPDIFNYSRMNYLEVKPLSISGIARAIVQMAYYELNFAPEEYYPDREWAPRNQPITIPGLQVYVANVAGVLFYTDVRDNLEDLAGLTAIGAVRAIIPKLFSLARGGQIAETGRIGQLITSSGGGMAAEEAEQETEVAADVLEDVA